MQGMKKAIAAVLFVIILSAGLAFGQQPAREIPTYERPNESGNIRQMSSPLRVLKMTSKVENDRYFASLSGTWLSIEVQNVSDMPIKTFSARVGIVDEMHERIHDTLKLQFARESLIPRHLEPGKRLTFESRLGDYKMPSDWEYGKAFDSAWVSQHVKILSVTFKDGSVWTAEKEKN
jgi:hypothetical protein